MNSLNSLNRLKKWLGIKDTLKMFEREERGIYTTEPIKEKSIIIKMSFRETTSSKGSFLSILLLIISG